ncbi:Phosphosulfolactate synthase [Ruegeria sp. THAF57]|uniref:phosphosulfolactate synthase n=1 Tax=Ruegeria sp. THAF57 TaxID=2744555 RepID=UPI0015DE40FA|nr:phosphosulfolactate synthase [Ruegeria sp. THAF57]CAD0186832.1 Phosphosulfolactate synthase [Ruegeria sp. THAF57]
MLADPSPCFLDLAPRSPKPRMAGLTHVLDKGCTVSHTRDVIQQAAGMIDIWKFGWGISYIDPNVRTKVAELREAGIKTCTGGTLMEISRLQDQVGPMLRFAAEVGFDCVEISDGASEIPVAEKQALISRARDTGFEVLAEVGSKDPNQTADAEDWIAEIEGDLAAGASWIVAEGRESGTVGLYQSDGRARCTLIEALMRSEYADKMIFEAPRRDQQVLLISHFGSEVNLGNIQLDEVLGLETLRLGLRADTMRTEHVKKAGADVRL